jgi:hypothetical protein
MFTALLSALSSQLPLADAGAQLTSSTISDSSVITVGAIVAVAVVAQAVASVWDAVRPKPPLEDKIARALALCSSHCHEKIAAVATEVGEVKKDRVRNMQDLWGAIDGLKSSISMMSSDLNRALGRLEGRDEMKAELKRLLEPKGA